MAENPTQTSETSAPLEDSRVRAIYEFLVLPGTPPALHWAVVARQIVDYIDTLNEQQEAVLAQAYQVVGSLLSDVGQFGSAHAKKILDNLAQRRLVHADVLPWPSFNEATQRLNVDAARAYEAGWSAAADWAERQDLIADIGSPAYLAELDAALARIGGEQGEKP